MRILRWLIPLGTLLGTLLTGCGDMGCTATQSCSPVSTTTTQTTPSETDIHDSIVKSLKEAGFQFATDPYIAQGLWVRGDDQVIFSASDLLQGSIVIAFPEGKLICNTLGADPSGYNPLNFINKAKADGYAKTQANQPTCGPIPS